jgi:hypothetical protein
MGLFDKLFPEQRNILQQWHQVKSISYKDDDLALETILFSIIKSCKNGEKSIVVIPDKILYQKFISDLSEFHLEQISLIYDPNLSVSKSDVTTLQNKLYLSKNNEKSIAYLDTLFTNKRLTEQCRDILASIYDYTGDRNLISVLERCHDISNFDTPEIVQGIMYDLFPDLDENTFEMFYDSVVVASKIYQPSYYLQKENRKFNVSHHNVQDEENLELFLSNLGEQIKALENLRNRYYRFIDDDLKQSLRELYAHYQKIKETFSALQFYMEEFLHYNTINSKSGFVSLFGTKPKIQVALEEKCRTLFQKMNRIFEETPGLEESSFSMEDLKKNINEVQDVWVATDNKIDEWFTLACKNQRLSIKNSNKFNQKNKNTLQELDDELKSWSNKFNQFHFFDKKIEINTLSTQKQIELLNELILQITYIYDDVQDNKGYYLWHSYLHRKEEWVQKSIILLQNFPVRYWPEIVEYCYLYRWLSEKKNPDSDRLPLLLDELKNSEKTICNEWAKDFVKSKKSEWTNRIQNLNKEEKALYKDIQQNKNIEKLNWRYFFEKNAKFWSYFFDIVVSSTDKFEDMEFGHYTQFFYINALEINPEVLHLGKTIHSFYRFKDDQEISTDFRLFNTKNPLVKNMIELPPVEKLNVSKNLAYNFYSLQNKFSIFQLKNASVISCFSIFINSLVKEYFINEGIKEIAIGASPLERLIECIVETDRKSFLLLPDHLLNPADTSAVSVQLSVISDFKKAGFSICSLETSEVIRNGYGKAIKNLCSELKDSFNKGKE